MNRILPALLTALAMLASGCRTRVPPPPTSTTSASPSQSARSVMIRWVLPLVSPLRHRQRRLRL